MKNLDLRLHLGFLSISNETNWREGKKMSTKLPKINKVWVPTLKEINQLHLYLFKPANILIYRLGRSDRCSKIYADLGRAHFLMGGTTLSNFYVLLKKFLLISEIWYHSAHVVDGFQNWEAESFHFLASRMFWATRMKKNQFFVKFNFIQ